MPLVDYSSSDNDDCDNEITPAPKKWIFEFILINHWHIKNIKKIFLYSFNLRLVLPNKIKSIHFGSNDNDDPNETNQEIDGNHNGRIRTFPHERGNWATYVYIRCKCVCTNFTNNFHLIILYYFPRSWNRIN